MHVTEVANFAVTMMFVVVPRLCRRVHVPEVGSVVIGALLGKWLAADGKGRLFGYSAIA